jgi:hypothetical protein
MIVVYANQTPSRPPGAFRDIENGIEGAPGPMFIHTDKSKTKAKEAEERERQRNGEDPQEAQVAPRFLDEFVDSPEVKIATTHSGSMTQEAFYLYVTHFLEARPKDSGPIILLLDGHGSRWSVPALRKLIANNVYPFIFASHTSIWAQPNDAGVNKRFHWAIEESAKKERRGEDQATLPYFNHILNEGWVFFLEAERKDLRALGLNNTTNAYARTGIFPLDPFASAWTEAIETLGGVENAREREVRPRAQYEVLLKGEMPEITEAEKMVLRANLTLDPLIDESDYAVALIRGGEILAKWRKAIHAAVMEGEVYESIARAIMPGSVATDDAHRVAIKMIQFEFVDIFTVLLPKKATKEEREYTASVRIVKNTKMSEPVKITYLESTPGETPEVSTIKRVRGTAIKRKDCWKVFLNDGRELQKCEMDLVNAQSFFVDYAYENLTDEQKRRQKQKEKRERAREQVLLEEDLKTKAKEERLKGDRQEFEKMCEKIVRFCETNGKSEQYTFVTYQEMVEKLRAPFTMDIDGHTVTVSAADTAIMLKQSAIATIKKHIIGEKRRGTNNELGSTSKKQRTGGKPTCPTTNGAEGFTALHQSTGRDVRLTEAARKKSKCALDAESKNIDKALKALQKRKQQCTKALELRRKQRQQQQTIRDQQEEEEDHPQQAQGENENGVQREPLLETSPVEIMIPALEAPLDEYWEVNANSAQDVLVLMLRMFLPTGGVLSKPRATQWGVIEEKILPCLSKAAMDAKQQEYERRMATIVGELAELTESNVTEEETAVSDVGTTE